MTANSSPRVFPGLQAVPDLVAPSADAAGLAEEVLKAETGVAHALNRVAEHFIHLPRVDVVVTALTTFAPEDTAGWIHLGQRAWLREWLQPGAPCRILPAKDAGPEAALTTPWMSQLARHDVVALPDIEQLPPEAEQDRRELAGCQVRAVMASSQISDGTMYGSLSMASAHPGDWPETYVADLRLLSAALTSRMAVERSKRAQAEAIALGDQARATQQQFFATVGHELRTPVAAIVGFAEVLADDAREHGARSRQDAAFAQSVERDSGVILRAGEQLLAIVEDLLSTGRVLGGEMLREDQDVAQAVEDVVHWHRTPALAGEVTVISNVPPGTHVYASAAGVRQVLTNLIGNAIIHNRRGGTVEISAQQSRGEGREPRVRISVRDTGPGLAAEDLDRVFEPFVRFAGTEVKGTGLGLPLARTVAERDGGVVGGESVPGQGSVFWVDLPAG